MDVFLNLFSRVNWGEYYFLLFAQGKPPLAFQLLVANSIIMVLMIVRRTLGKSYTSPAAARVLQILLLVANIVLLSKGDLEFY